MSKVFVVTEMHSGSRIDLVLSDLLGISRSAAAKLCGNKLVWIEHRIALKSDTVTTGMQISVETPQNGEKPLETPAELPNIYADDDLVVVDKPVGMAAHAAAGWDGPTVLGALLANGIEIQSSGDQERRGIVHRLDVGTSGLMVVARNEYSYQHLKEQFAERRVEKIYHTVVQGYMEPASGTVDAPIGRDIKNSFKMAVIATGKPAVTHYRTLKRLNQATLLQVHLETGRTHQIRVHMQALGHNVVGDPMYGGNPRLARELGLSRQWLHAYGLGFVHPTNGMWMEFRSNYPRDLEIALDRLRPQK